MSNEPADVPKDLTALETDTRGHVWDLQSSPYSGKHRCVQCGIHRGLCYNSTRPCPEKPAPDPTVVPPKGKIIPPQGGTGITQPHQVPGPPPPVYSTEDIRQHSGKKYMRAIHSCVDVSDHRKMVVDVYSVIKAFDVPAGPIDHAVKKLLCAGVRDKGSRLQDLREARDAISRAILDAEREELMEYFANGYQETVRPTE